MSTARLGSVLAQLPFMRTPDSDLNVSRAVHLHGVISTAREAAQRYRANVLSHPDLADRLVQLFGYQRPGGWTGYIPPRTDGFGAYNPSPYRAALVPIVVEALQRSGDWRGYDSDRLATVPDRHIGAPWAEHQTPPTPTTEESAWPESGR